jgi:hypothetical protein
MDWLKQLSIGSLVYSDLRSIKHKASRAKSIKSINRAHQNIRTAYVSFYAVALALAPIPSL